MTDVRIFATGEELAQAAADLFVTLADDTIDAREEFHVALSGGSTPRPVHMLLTEAPRRDRVDWSKVSVYWGDERCVPPDHPDSNYRMARETLLAFVPIPEAQIHRMEGEREPEQAAADYGRMLRDQFVSVGPDLILLGMGPDGHTASLFPHTGALREAHHRCVANYVDKLDTWRLTMTAGFINSARNVVFVVAGAEKAEALKHVLHGESDPETYPSQLIKPERGRLIWLVDAATASKL
jgi:6-phosphogluconolactonase